MSAPVPFYPEQLRWLANACDKLAEADADGPDQLYIDRVPIRMDDELYGWLEDEAGWRFVLATDDEVDADKAARRNPRP